MIPKWIYTSILAMLSFGLLVACQSAEPKRNTSDGIVRAEYEESTGNESADSILPGQGCVKGDCNTGRGTFVYPDGERYEGDFKNGIRSGYGTLKYKNGDEYIGPFKKDKKHGYGKYTYQNGEYYEGEFFEGKMKGLGTYYFNDNTLLKGDFEENGRIGNGLLLRKNQKDHEKGRTCRIENRTLYCSN